MTIDAHRVRATDAVPTGAPKDQAAVYVILDIMQGIQHPISGLNAQFILTPPGLFVLFRVKPFNPEMNFHLLPSSQCPAISFDLIVARFFRKSGLTDTWARPYIVEPGPGARSD